MSESRPSGIRAPGCTRGAGCPASSCVSTQALPVLAATLAAATGPDCPAPAALATATHLAGLRPLGQVLLWIAVAAWLLTAAAFLLTAAPVPGSPASCTGATDAARPP
ncbi:hypothetical protein [Kitasatospora cathayae]|uniref:Uncharacterized protein n=1 Tax=Kitasatospora cathayae TaxID=3004092 RepID=A0ABY7PYE8_9ACTN|nr:hypothetical protein [Kitasatospora sp. HUAS 3-15]WBP85026.1 hypothetical protein O1G21_03595 [Kitasatospora sp. HUAS 3-15]